MWRKNTMNYNKNETIDIQAQNIDEEKASDNTSLAVIDSNALINLPSPEVVAEIAKRYKAYMSAACSVLSSADIVNIGGQPFIEHLGCKKIAGLFKLIIKTNEKDGRIDYKKIVTDENTGEYYVSISGKIYFAGDPDNYEVYEGTCKAMHSFFKEHHNNEISKVQLVPIQRVQEKALANFMQRALKKKIGLKFTWDEIEKFTDFSKEDCKGYDFKNNTDRSKDDSKDIKDLRYKTWKMFLDVYTDPKEAEYALQAMTTWEKEDGTKIKGKSKIEHISENQLIKIVYPSIKKEHEELFGKQ
jgi:hypothetical protein